MADLGEQVSEQRYAYRGFCEHGKVRALCVDMPEMRKEAAKLAKEAIERGGTLDRVTVEEARKSDMKCEACDARKK